MDNMLNWLYMLWEICTGLIDLSYTAEEYKHSVATNRAEILVYLRNSHILKKNFDQAGSFKDNILYLY